MLFILVKNLSASYYLLKPPVCCWYTSMVSPSSMSKTLGVSFSFMGLPSNRKRTTCILKPCQQSFSQLHRKQSSLQLTARSQYACINFLSGVCFFILNCTTALSCPNTFRLMCSGSVFCKGTQRNRYQYQ